ncbi:MAG: nitroreductase family deazaflavin-dependent oxidoreductase [Actinomycetota bacterium]
MNQFLEFNKQVIEEFRANDGVCGGPFEGMPMILVNMVGAKSGRQLTTPLVYSTDGDDIVIIASAAGAPKHPNWYHNLVANPTVNIEVGADSWEATAELAEGDERRRLYDAQAEAMPQFKGYEESAGEVGREIPVFKLVRAAS